MMIRSLRLENFKCFRDETLALRPLTLVVGANGAGKSSVLQGMLLAKQAGSAESYVKLNGPFLLNLGKAADVLCQSRGGPSDTEHASLKKRQNGRAQVAIELTWDDESQSTWRFEERPKEEYILGVVERPRATTPPLELTYLHAERIGPRDTLHVDSVPGDDLNVGVRGEFTAQVLEAYVLSGRRRKVRPELWHPRTEDGLADLGKQAELWMGDIAPGIELRALTLPDTNMSAMRFKRAGVATEWLRPPNTGFGISYALPIIVAGLLAPPGSMLLVENPEAHLHPAGQSRIGRFLATLAAAGVQVIAETHSDHVLNGVRLAAVDSAHRIQHDQIIVQYFHGQDDAPVRARAIDVTAKGGLSSWPAGFFDQSEKDLAAILEARRRG